MFRVEWREEALDELTTLWLQADAPGRQAITAASHALDQHLFLPWPFVSRLRQMSKP